jgi:hypothetical protein
MSSDYKVPSRSEDYIAAVAVACRQARPQQNPYRFDPTDFIENVLMVDGVEAVWPNRWALPKGNLHLKLFDRASKWDPPAEVSFCPKITLHFDRSFWARAKAGETHETFIAAHEIGHILLHDVTAKEFSNELEARISFRKSDDESAEWQAHTFAGHLLLPTPVVQKIDDLDRLAFLCNAPDALVAERLATVRKIKKILNPHQTLGRLGLQDYCPGCGHFKDVAEGGVCFDCEKTKGKANG